MNVNDKVKVLIIDDEPIVGERLKRSLEKYGFDVVAFSSSEDALERLRQEPFDILVTDLKMKGVGGMEALQIARTIRPAIKSVVITGFATQATADEARNSGAAEFVAKPFRISQLRDILLRLVGREHPAGET